MGVELGHGHDLSARLDAMEDAVRNLSTQDLLQNASIGAGGLTVDGGGGITVTGGGSLTITGTGTLNVASGGLNSAGSISAGTTITAGGTISSTGGDIDGVNVNASSNITAGGNLSVGGTTTATGDIFTPNATAAVSGYTICYLNSDGRVSKGASSARYKVSITPVDPASLGDLFPALQSYAMRDDPEQTPHVGLIAEHLAGNPDQVPFVVWQYDGGRPAVDDQGAHIPESIDFIGLLLAQTAQLHQRLKAAGL